MWKNIAMSKIITDLGIHRQFENALSSLNISEATEIQQQVVPYILNETEDLIALAQTGTGKTAAFGLPLLQMVNTHTDSLQTLILAPTRELAQQIFKNLIDYAKDFPSIEIALFTGGDAIKDQVERLKLGVHIAIATPGRLLDLVNQNVFHVDEIEHLVLDEADEMIQSFEKELIEVLTLLPKKKRSYLFSATMSGELKNIVHNYMSKNPMYITSEMENLGKKDIQHQYLVVEPIEKLDVLLHFLSTQDGKSGIIFCRTKAAVNKLAKNLAKRKISSGALHGSLTQGIRDRIMDQFREGHINILVATDLVARGIDVKELGFVVNYHLPDTHTTYVHRSGRTGRAGAKGLSMTILQKEEVEQIPVFEEALEIQFDKIEKATAKDISSNNAVVWANKVLKTKLEKDIPESTKQEVMSVFNRLSKDELIDKLLSNYWKENKK